MSYAIRKDGLGWRAVNSQSDVGVDESFSETQPIIVAAPTQLQLSFTRTIQQRLDDFAKTRNYDSILSACTYATSLMTKSKVEGKTCVNLRDATWAAAYDILAQVEAGTRPMPESIADIEADLPALVWSA